MKNFINLVILFSVSISISSGQFDIDFQEYLKESMAFIEQELDPVGLSISVRKGDQEWNGTLGISSVDDSLNISSTFGMASATKTFVSAAILKMMEEGRLTLSDPLHMYLPTFDNIDSTVTIKELLNHTSGIQDFCKHPEFFNVVLAFQNQSYKYSPEEVLELFVLEKRFDRGTSQIYSNTNYILLGMIITEIAGRPYWEEIFDTFSTEGNYPSISCPPFTSESSGLADAWTRSNDDIQNLHELGVVLDGLLSAVGAAGAFAGTPSDLSQWGYDLYSGKVLSESSMDSLFGYHPFLLNGVDEYGLGVFNRPNSCGLNSVGHDGFLIYSSDMVYAEEQDLCVVIMTNDNTDSYTEIGGLETIREEILCAYENSIMTNSKDISDTEGVKYYPNPVVDILTISLPHHFKELVQVDIYDQKGTLAYSQKTQRNSRLNLEIESFDGLESGVYYIKVSDGYNTYSDKLIKI